MSEQRGEGNLLEHEERARNFDQLFELNLKYQKLSISNPDDPDIDCVYDQIERLRRINFSKPEKMKPIFLRVISTPLIQKKGTKIPNSDGGEMTQKIALSGNSIEVVAGQPGQPEIAMIGTQDGQRIRFRFLDEEQDRDIQFGENTLIHEGATYVVTVANNPVYRT